MKTIKRLTVGQLSEMELLSLREQSRIVGGSGCVWKCLAHVWDCYDGNDQTSNKEYNGYVNDFRDKWNQFQEGNVLPNGDPAASQSEDLYNFVSAFFNTTTGSGWGTSEWGNMITSSGAINRENGCSNSGMALVMIGDEKNQHALVINGNQQYDPTTGKSYYNCYDPDEKMTRVYTDDIRYGTGLGKKY